MNIVEDHCHLLGRFFFWGGGGGVNLTEPDQQADFDHFPPISTTSSRALSFNFHIN